MTNSEFKLLKKQITATKAKLARLQKKYRKETGKTF